MIEMAVAALLGALRRAGELADAIEARGGASVVRYDAHHVRRSDVVALSILCCVIVAIGLLA
jgi:energy-coupling factor transporter transmembrane protein EcfT